MGRLQNLCNSIKNFSDYKLFKVWNYKYEKQMKLQLQLELITREVNIYMEEIKRRRS